MQKTLCCDSLYRQNIFTLEIHCQLMVVFGDSVLRLHHVGRGCREFKSWLASIIMIDISSQQIKNKHMNTSQVVKMVLENQQETCTYGIQQSMGMVGTKMHEGISQIWMFGGAFSLLQSFTGVANRFTESIVTFWEMRSPFSLKSIFKAMNTSILIDNHKM